MKNKTFLDSLKCAMNGIIAGINNEKNFKIYLLHILITFPINILFGLSFIEHVIYFVILAGVFSAECFNTVAERISDILIKEKDDRIKYIKDIAAGGVLYWGIAFYSFELIQIILFLVDFF